MGLFKKLFRKENAESVLLVDITAGSVGGAYTRHVEGETPTLVYARRMPIEHSVSEEQARAMLRALAILADALISEGAPALHRHVGSGKVDRILVSVDAPWQETAVRTEYFEGDKNFTFTKSLVAEAMKKAGCASSGRILCNESVVGTVLNGYETREPYGKKAHRASVIVLSSLIEQSVVEGITNILGRVYHAKDVELISGCSLRYQALRSVFPHEHNTLILDGTGPLISLELVRNDLLVAVSETSDGGVPDAKWQKDVDDGLAQLSARYPLPRTIFVITRETETEEVRQALSSAKLGSHWLSDNPPKILTVLPSHLSGLVKHLDNTRADLPLLLMAIYARPK